MSGITKKEQRFRKSADLLIRSALTFDDIDDCIYSLKKTLELVKEQKIKNKRNK